MGTALNLVALVKASISCLSGLEKLTLRHRKAACCSSILYTSIGEPITDKQS